MPQLWILVTPEVDEMEEEPEDPEHGAAGARLPAPLPFLRGTQLSGAAPSVAHR